MATYCKNHVKEEVKKLESITKGKIERIPTKEGMCGHVGGCNTAHDDLYRLKYEYPAPKENVKAAKKAEAKAKDEAETTASTTEETTSVTGDKPTEEATVTS